jgi:hypothetical protein
MHEGMAEEQNGLAAPFIVQSGRVLLLALQASGIDGAPTSEIPESTR